MTETVHWHEGLFLQPHHLQMMQRSFVNQFGAERQLAWSYPYGLVEARLSQDALENMLVRFERLKVVMPSGLTVDYPQNSELPPLNIKEAFEGSSGSFTVFLGVPLWDAHRSNSIEPSSGEDRRVKKIYNVVEASVEDENTGDNARDVMLRRINARLMLQDDDPTDMEMLPLLRIAHATGESVGLPRQDPAYVPPCFFMRGSPTLNELVRDLSNQIEASRKELVVQITRGGFSVETMRGMQFEQVMRLSALNRVAGRLPSMVEAPNISPFEMYLELREALGELAALRPDRDQFEVVPYDHDNPLIAFMELAEKTRSLLKGAVTASFLQVPFRKEGDLLMADLTEEHTTVPNQYFLGIKSAQDPREIAKLLEDADMFKFMAKPMIESRVRGVVLKEERHAPLELPSQVGLSYFRLLHSDSKRMWDQIINDKGVAIKWPGMATSDFEITLYMTIPSGSNG